MLFLARKHNRKLFNTISLPFIEQHTPQYIPTTFNERYLNYDFIYPYYQQNKVLAIKSPYGTGKTQFLAKLFEQLPTDKSILFITPRVSLSYTQLKSFPHFYHYQNKTITEITNAKQLIIQLDSIYKLDNTNTTNKILINNSKLFVKYQTPKEQPTDTHIKYDIIALDEIESLLYHLSFNKINNRNIFKILSNLCHDSDKIIALDGDFSNRSHHFLQNILTNNQQIAILENTYKPSPKHFIFTNNQGEYYKDIDDALNDKKKIVIICLTLETSEYFYSRYSDKYKVIIHNSIQNDKAGLSDVNEHWKCDLLIYTSTIETGCDHNTPWFDNCYIVLSDKGTTPRALMQMNYRVRHFANSNVLVYNNGVPFYEFQIPYQFQEVKESLFKQFQNDRGELNTLDTILCYNEVETLNKNYFITIFTQMIINKGHTYEYRRTDKPQNSKIKSDIYNEIANADNITSETEYNGIVELLKQGKLNNQGMRSCYCTIKKYIVAKLWSLNIETINIDDVKKYYPKINKLLNYKFFIKYIHQKTTNFNNIKLARKIEHVQNILLAFGITHQDQFQFSIDCGTSSEGRTKNKKNNPNIIKADQWDSIRTTLLPTIKDKEFRMLFNLDKGEQEISNRQYLETLKKIISEYGFTIIVNETFPKNDSRKTVQVNTYFIDLDISIIELLNNTSRDYADDIIDGVPSNYNEYNEEEEEALLNANEDNPNNQTDIEADHEIGNESESDLVELDF